MLYLRNKNQEVDEATIKGSVLFAFLCIEFFYVCVFGKACVSLFEMSPSALLLVKVHEDAVSSSFLLPITFAGGGGEQRENERRNFSRVFQIANRKFQEKGEDDLHAFFACMVCTFQFSLSFRYFFHGVLKPLSLERGGKSVAKMERISYDR